MPVTLRTIDKLIEIMTSALYDGVSSPGANDPAKIAAISASIESLANARASLKNNP
jgi:hypothetical protein